MKVTAVALFTAWPPSGGAAAVTASLMRFLPGDRVLVQVGHDDSCIQAANGLRVMTIRANDKQRLTKLFGYPRFARRIAEAVAGTCPEVIVVEGASWAVYLERFVARMRRELPGVPVVYHAHNVEYELRRYREVRFIAAVTKVAERRLVCGSDKCFAVSERDAALLEQLYGRRPQILPNGVDTEAFVPVSRARPGAPQLLFMGAYAYPPNREAIDFLVRRVMPGIVERFPLATLTVTGGHVPHREPWLRDVGLVPHGELPALVSGSTVGLAPIFSGSGSRLKILEYLAGGLPVVATAKGVEGLELEDGLHLRVVAPVDFADAVGGLLADPGAAVAMAARGRAVVAERFDWRVIAASFADSLRSLAADEVSRAE